MVEVGQGACAVPSRRGPSGSQDLQGYKPAGGIATAGDALKYMALMKEELGTHYLSPHLFRFGASSLLTDIERQLEHHVTGRYSAFNRHAAG